MIDLFGKQALSGMSNSFQASSPNSILSKLTIGTMKFADRSLSAAEVKNLFESSIERGVNTFHVSSEYSSYNLVCKTFRCLSASKRKETRIIAKLSEPHFNKNYFSKKKIQANVDEVLKSTGLEKIDVLQWMWRISPLNDDLRINRSSEQVSEMKETFSEFESSGKVGKISCFPYSPAYMKYVRGVGLCNSQVNYLNFWDESLICGGIGPDSIVLRALGAGKYKKITDKEVCKINEAVNVEAMSALEHCLRFPLSHENISSVVVGINSIKQLYQAAEIVDVIEPNMP